MLVAMLVLPVMDTIAKYLSDSLASGQIAWSRFFFQSLFLLPFALRLKAHWRNTPWQYHAARGFFIATATLFFFTSLIRLPVADALAIFFVEPLILTALSPFFLGEKIGWRRITAVATGFLGALLIIKPSTEVFGYYALLPLAASICFAFYLILTRKLALQTDPVIIQFFTGLAGMLLLAIVLAVGTTAEIQILSFTWPSNSQWWLLAVLGAIGCTAHLLVVYAFSLADASLLAPLQYFEILGATILGWYIFSDIPALSTWLGIIIIVASGVYVMARENAG
jgi:S-adenosylmethionine uptake transporter